MAEGTGNFQLKGVAPVEEWRKRVDLVAAQIHRRDAEMAKQIAAVKKKRNIAIGVIVAIGIAVIAAIGFHFIVHVGMGVVVAGWLLARFVFKPPPADFIGQERVKFVRELLALFADIAPKGLLKLAAQLDLRVAVPPAKLPKGSDSAIVSEEKKEVWLSGASRAIPGLRLAWQVIEWRTVRIVRKTVRGARKTKIKTKAKFALATRLAVRLDVDRALFAMKPVANPQRAQDGESSVEVRERAGGWSLRGARDLKLKTPLWTADVLEAFATLREQGKTEWFGQPAASLINLMKLCEGRLLPATLPSPAKGSAP